MIGKVGAMEVFVSETGFCWGIELAYARIDKLAAQASAIKATHRGGGGPGWDPIKRISAGDAQLIKQYPHLARVEVVEDLTSLRENEVVAIGHQGVDPGPIDAAKAKGVEVRDFKCPFIARYDKMAESLVADGFDLIAFGKPKNHHCLYAKEVAERGGRAGLIAETIGEIEHELRDPARKWACIAQVTGNVQVWQEFQAGLGASGIPVRVVDTVCTDSNDRQAEAATTCSAGRHRGGGR